MQIALPPAPCIPPQPPSSSIVQRPRRRARVPARWANYVPTDKDDLPPHLADAFPEPPAIPPSPSPSQYVAPTIEDADKDEEELCVWQTPPTSFGLYREYITPPQRDPEARASLMETTECYKDNKHAAIFRAQLSDGSGLAQDVVCKIVPMLLPQHLGVDGRSSLRREASIYQEKLSDLQGKCIPRFIGLFRWTTPDGITSLECLITTWEGYSFDIDPWKCSPACRSRILDTLQKTHRAGVRHFDLESLPNNVLIKDDTGEIFFVDFAQSGEHSCQLPNDYQFQFYTPIPDFGECNCFELRSVAHQLAVWYPAWYDFLGDHTIPSSEVLQGRKSLINYMKNLGVEYSEDLLEEGADRAIEELQSLIDQRKAYDRDFPLSIPPE
ncbi:hypothetical protein C8Q79DRAFT_1117599 [Trametes meyenii]|nr:hypothetical protein C8Q79DRAFT_1117599 [Trametes meyenii]